MILLQIWATIHLQKPANIWIHLRQSVFLKTRTMQSKFGLDHCHLYKPADEVDPCGEPVARLPMPSLIFTYSWFDMFGYILIYLIFVFFWWGGCSPSYASSDLHLFLVGYTWILICFCKCIYLCKCIWFFAIKWDEIFVRKGLINFASVSVF